MKNSKKLFLVFVVIFFGAMAWIVYDISSRTTFPGSKSQLQEQIIEDYESDSTKHKLAL